MTLEGLLTGHVIGSIILSMLSFYMGCKSVDKNNFLFTVMYFVASFLFAIYGASIKMMI